MKTTNIQSSELNYDHYSADKYDRDIINAIPHHKELHEEMVKYVKNNFNRNKKYAVLDLGVVTGITSEIIKNALPRLELDVVDFSKKMLAGAKKKLGAKNVNYLFGDYSKMRFSRKYDMIVSVIGVHHQNNVGKRLLFKKIFSSLKPGGVFIFGDLVTYKDEKVAALNQAIHLCHLVKNASDDRTLKDWAHHHLFLNELAPIEDQSVWLKESGFRVMKALLKINTALLICKK